MIEYSNVFDWFENDETSRVFMFTPRVFSDNRGSFAEILKDVSSQSCSDVPTWFTNLHWIKQMNRSISNAGTIRGCHAQKAPCCQGKLVEALTEQIYDVITDTRPDSKTFGATQVYLLDPTTQNKLWVPHGFLHAFVVPSDAKEPAIFQYFCDDVYSHDSEFGIAPMSLMPKVISELEALSGNIEFNESYARLFKTFRDKNFTLSEKDTVNPAYEDWMQKVKDEYDKTGKVWYR